MRNDKADRNFPAIHLVDGTLANPAKTHIMAVNLADTLTHWARLLANWPARFMAETASLRIG
jgi:hypothetical protein